MSDYIATLPVDNEPLPPDQQHLIDDLSLQNRFKFARLLSELKGPLILCAIFFLINHPVVSTMIQDSSSYAKSSEFSLLIVKTVLFLVFVFLYNNVHLVYA